MYIANFSPAASVYTMITKDERLPGLKEREERVTHPGVKRRGQYDEAGRVRDVARLTGIYLIDHNWP